MPTEKQLDGIIEEGDIHAVRYDPASGATAEFRVVKGWKNLFELGISGPGVDEPEDKKNDKSYYSASKFPGQDWVARAHPTAKMAEMSFKTLVDTAERFGWMNKATFLAMKPLLKNKGNGVFEIEHGVPSYPPAETVPFPIQKDTVNVKSIEIPLGPTLSTHRKYTVSQTVLESLSPVEIRAIEEDKSANRSHQYKFLEKQYFITAEFLNTEKGPVMEACYLMYRAWFLADLMRRNQLPANLLSTVPLAIATILEMAIEKFPPIKGILADLPGEIAAGRIGSREIVNIIKKTTNVGNEVLRASRVGVDGANRGRAKLVRRVEISDES